MRRITRFPPGSFYPVWVPRLTIQCEVPIQGVGRLVGPTREFAYRQVLGAHQAGRPVELLRRHQRGNRPGGDCPPHCALSNRASVPKVGVSAHGGRIPAASGAAAWSPRWWTTKSRIRSANGSHSAAHRYSRATMPSSSSTLTQGSFFLLTQGHCLLNRFPL